MSKKPKRKGATRPNWRTYTYPAADELTAAQWSWEFLRRNPEYQRDYKKLSRYPFSPSFIGHHPEFIKEAVHREAEFRMKWQINCIIDPRRGPEVVCWWDGPACDDECKLPMKDLETGEQWIEMVGALGARKAPHDRSEDCTCEFLFKVLPPGVDSVVIADNSIPEGATIYAKDNARIIVGIPGPDLDLERYLPVSVDLLSDVDAQIETIRWVAKHKQEVLEQNEEPRRPQFSKLPYYLRVLDAVDMGASTVEIAEVLHPEYFTNDQDPDSARRSIDKARETALAIRNGGYKLIRRPR